MTAILLKLRYWDPLFCTSILIRFEIRFMSLFRLKQLLEFTQLLRPRGSPRYSRIYPWRLTSIVPLLVEIGHRGSGGRINAHGSWTHVTRMVSIIPTDRAGRGASTRPPWASMTHTYSLVGRLAVTPIVHVLAADIARAFGIVFVLVVIIREELPFGVGNGVVAKDVGGRLGFLPKVVIL